MDTSQKFHDCAQGLTVSGLKTIPTKQQQSRTTMTVTKQRRWMQTAIQTANETQVSLPWSRNQRRRPAAVKQATATARKA